MKRVLIKTDGERGTALVAVLVAMVFIGIVAASMVKNTASQSAAAISYGGMMEMTSTVSSGAIATEAYIADTANASDVLAMLQRYIDDTLPSIDILPKSGGGKARLSDRQFFRSRIVSLDKEEFTAMIEIGAGRRVNGRDMRRAAAFFKLGNLEAVSNSVPEQYGAKNAVYMKGDLQDGNNAMEVKNGSATFEGRVKFQNRSAIFHGEAYFNDHVQILHPPEFRANAYFNQNLTVQNVPHDKAGVFKKDAGIRGKVSTEGGADLRADGQIYYGDGVLSKLNMDTLTSRRDPQLDLSKIPSELIAPVVDAAGNNLSVQKLNAAYDKAKADGRLYNDHLVLKVRQGDPINFNEPHDAVFDRKVIIIVEDGANLNVGGRFYHSSEKSSTLIYAGAGNATVNEFGASGLFRGLVYIDSLNTSTSNSFNWKNGGRIEGAFHNFSDKRFYWNTGSNTPVSVTFDEEVLNAYGFLLKGAEKEDGEDKEGETVKFTDGEERIDVLRVGIYYY